MTLPKVHLLLFMMMMVMECDPTEMYKEVYDHRHITCVVTSPVL